MKNNFNKIWLQKSLNKLAISRAQQAIENQGRALPCSVVSVNGSIVTVKFEMDATPFTLPNITIPKAEGPWVRSPTQVGDYGMTVPADVYLGGISGLGDGIATFAPQGALSTLVFVPVSNSNSPPDDPNAAQVQGPNGVILKTTQGTTSSAVINQSGTMVTFGANTASLTASGLAVTAPTNITGNTYVQGTLGTSSGASGTFLSQDGKTITVTNGIVTSIV